jgi:outer membrane protein TolC
MMHDAAYSVRRVLATVFVGCIALVAMPASRAQGNPPAPANLPAGQWRVSQTEFVQRVIALNVSSAAASLQVDAARWLLEAERALYDPVILARLRNGVQERPRTYDERNEGGTQNFAKDLSIERTNTATLGQRLKLPSGATVEVSQELRRRASNLLAAGDDREYRGTLSLAVRQPLLRGAGRDITEADIQVAEREQQIERQRFIKQLIDLTGDAAGTYWQIHRADRTSQMREQGLALARDLLQEVRGRVEGGFAPRVDLLEAELAVGLRETELLRAGQLVREAQARARVLLSIPAQLEAALRPVVAEPDAVQTSLAQAPAIEPPANFSERWPAYQIAQLRFEQETIRLGFAANQERPDAAIEVGAGSNSLRLNQMGGSVEDMARLRHPGWYAGVAVEFPLDNGAARSRRQAQTLRLQSARLQVQAEAITLSNEWANRRGQLVAALEERRQLQREVAGRERLLEAERENYELGRVRLRVLLETQDRLAESRIRLIDAGVREQVALLSLQAVTGELLDRFDVNAGPADRPAIAATR